MMKQALVAASFGTSVPEARGSITAVEEALAGAVPGYICIRAFTSPAIRRILAGRGETVPSLAEALEQLHGESVSRVVVQPTHLLYGYEYDKLKAEAEGLADRFETVVIGRPLLADNRDILRFADKIAETHPRQAGKAVVYMGHGTEHSANAVYPALQAALNLACRSDICIGTMRGRPGLEDILHQLKTPCKVKLLPLLLAAGNHAGNDMAIDWKNALERAGHSVQCEFTGLGELAWVREMYRDRLLDTIEI